MKKKLFLAIFLFLGVVTMKAQGDLKLGLNVGLPVGDMDGVTDLQLGADITYLYDVANIFGVGGMLGYSNFFADDSYSGDDVQFLPIAASGRIGFPRGLFVGADLGYAIGLTDGIDGGVYYRPKVGFRLLGLGFIASYSGVSGDGNSFNSVNLGVEFGF